MDQSKYSNSQLTQLKAPKIYISPNPNPNLNPNPKPNLWVYKKKKNNEGTILIMIPDAYRSVTVFAFLAENFFIRLSIMNSLISYKNLSGVAQGDP